MTFFLVITPFLRFSVLPYFHILHMVNPIPIFCALYTPYIHTHMLFSRFYTLLCALVTVDTAYTIYFFLIHHLIHHCTNSLSSLHTKTSPAKHTGVIKRHQLLGAPPVL